MFNLKSRLSDTHVILINIEYINNIIEITKVKRDLPK